MTNNDILRRIKLAFKFDETKMRQIFACAGFNVSSEQITDWFRPEDELEFQDVADIQLAIFLNGFIVAENGPKSKEKIKHEKELTNNLILGKLKTALNLKDIEIIQLLKSVQYTISQAELKALLCKPNQEHYQPCKDQILKLFLQAIHTKYNS